jgi:hypothetical protein
MRMLLQHGFKKKHVRNARGLPDRDTKATYAVGVPVDTTIACK